MKAFRIILSTLLVGLATLIFAPEIKAQQPAKSQIITEYNGKQYYIHTVQRKQTLRDISELYDVTVAEILFENKELKNNPKQGSIIRIPYKEVIVEEVVDTVVEKTMGENTITMIQGNLDAVYKGIVSDEYLELLTEGTKEDAEQAYLETMESEDCTPSLSQAQQLKALSQRGELTMDDIFNLLCQPKANQKEKVSFFRDDIRSFFPPNYSTARMQSTIVELLKGYQRSWQRRDRDER